METREELESFLKAAVRETTRGRLSNQGIAWSIMRVDGVYNGSTKFTPTIGTDLYEYGFSLLRAALELKERNGDPNLVRHGFEIAGRSFESLTTNSKLQQIDSGFIQIISACCYHLAGYSAIAFSILNIQDSFNNNQAERAIRLLILRDLKGLRNFASDYLASRSTSDEYLAASLKQGDLLVDEALTEVLNCSICRAISYFDFALQTGNPQNVAESKRLLQKVIDIAKTGGFVTLWWIGKITIHLLDDLWEHSLHSNLPINTPDEQAPLYSQLRKKFILNLYNRDVSEVELWPSQVEAARRSIDITDDLVVALPTSAGKTRIAEIASLVTLSYEKRIVIVTPLRALSAQTERSFKKTFVPLGYTVSSLYGAIGMSNDDQDALKDKSIVIATPEKLDFALRNDSSLLDDVGLLILDEGHMIGTTDREIRYEILVQRLLRRSDSASRRIVCLSAILPQGPELDNFTQWLRSDAPGTPVKFPWRPTRQRFGVLTWQGRDAILNFDHRNEIPFINNFLTLSSPRGRDQNERPTDLNEKTLFAAWKFANQGKRVLIFITQANWVEKYGANAVKLVNKGYLDSQLTDKRDIEKALSVGEEWLGKGHPAVKALAIGMAIHHGGLPAAFLRELELLLAKGIIKITAASPTLSQGININAAVLLVPYLVRSGIKISGEEFANVAGRAGRAFVDMEGFVVHVIEDQIVSRRRNWERLVASARERNLSSGLFQVISAIYTKLSEKSNLKKETTFEYLASNIESWHADSPPISDETTEMDSMEFLIEKLDATVLGLINALDSEDPDLAHLLEEALKGSLWARQVDTLAAPIKRIHLRILTARAQLIWKTTTPNARRGHFAMGVGFETGMAIDSNADELENLLDIADEAAIDGEVTSLSEALIKLVEKLLSLRPFSPNNPLPEDWKSILIEWISGKPVEEIGPENIPFIEDTFAYRMIWALEALRMRRIAHGWTPMASSGAASACLENGVPRFRMAMLIRSGLPSRVAAIKAVQDGNATFVDRIGMAIWLRGRIIRARNKNTDWPSIETREIWNRFYTEFFSGSEQPWSYEEKTIRTSHDKINGVSNGQYRVKLSADRASFYFPDFKPAFSLKVNFGEDSLGVVTGKVNTENRTSTIVIERFGPGTFTELTS